MSVKAKIFIGCSGWFYWHWVGKFYPEELKPYRWLEYYAKRFNTVEVNATFYRIPKESMLKGWLKRTPDGFKFSLKANRRITHDKKLRGIKRDLKVFYSLANMLGEKLGCILFQFPPSIKFNKKLLKDFVEALDKNFRNVIEFRHKSWFNAESYDMLKKGGVGFCIVSAPKLPDDCEKTAKFVYVRFHGAKRWYNYDYSSNELRSWADRLKKLKAREYFIYFNNDVNCYAVKNAKMVKRYFK